MSPVAVADWLSGPLPAIELTTDVLTLRRWRPTDAPALAAAWADPEIARRLRPPDHSVEAAARWIDGCAARAAVGLATDAVIVVDGAVAGEVGLHAVDRRRRAALVGYWVGAGHRGSGIATAALAAVTRWWFDAVDGWALVAQCETDNEASWRTARGVGYELLAEDRDGLHVLACRRDAMRRP